MSIANDNPDVIIITEVNPKSQVNPITAALLTIVGYECLLNFDLEKYNLGIRGVAIFYKKSITVVEVQIDNKQFRDHLWIEIPISNKEPLLCVRIYRSPSNDTDREKSIESTKHVTTIINQVAQRK